jgi:hypothetical protein
VAAGDGWLVAVSAYDSVSPTWTIYIASLSATGAQVGPFQTPVFAYTANPNLAAAGAQVRMSFSRNGWPEEVLYVAPLTTSGASAGAATQIGTMGDFQVGAPIAINGNETLMLTAPPTNERLDLLHVDGGDAADHAVRTIATDSINTKTIARRGSEFIVAWINGSPSHVQVHEGPMGIGMARIAP